MGKEGGCWALGKEAQGWPDSPRDPGQAAPPLRASAPSCQAGTSGKPWANCVHHPVPFRPASNPALTTGKGGPEDAPLRAGPYLVARLPGDRERHLLLLTGHNVLPGREERGQP